MGTTNGSTPCTLVTLHAGMVETEQGGWRATGKISAIMGCSTEVLSSQYFLDLPPLPLPPPFLPDSVFCGWVQGAGDLAP